MKKAFLFATLAVLSLMLSFSGIIVNNYTKIYWLGIGIIIIGVIFTIVFTIFCVKQKRANKHAHCQPTSYDQKKIKTVKVLGTRAGLETRVLGTYNFTVYSLLILYSNGEQEVIECGSNSDKFKELIQYIEIDKNPTTQSEPLTIDEMIEYDEMND